jgi:hypothetical protein
VKLVAKKPQVLAVWIVGLATLALGEEPAEASPPASRAALFTRESVETPPHASGGLRSEYGRLDLRAPSDFTLATRSASDSGSKLTRAVPFPRRSTNRAPNEEQPNEEEPNEESSRDTGRDTGLAISGRLANSGLAMNSTSRAEELTRRFHRQGLPVARLLETHSAMVSLGLSPRGKPGIWLIQKLP